MRPYLAACSLLLPALASCASFRGTANSDAGPGQACESARFPGVLPSADAVVDSSALVRGLGDDASWQQPGTFALLSITYDPSGDAAYPVLLGGTLPTPAKQAPGGGLEARVREVVRRPSPADSVWGVRLRIDGGPLRLAVQRQQYCRPKALGTLTRDISASRMRQTLTISDRQGVSAMDAQPTTRPVTVRALVDANGTVRQTVVTYSDFITTGQLRSLIEQSVPGLTFLPARRDGVPEPAWTTLYATLSVR